MEFEYQYGDSGVQQEENSPGFHMVLNSLEEEIERIRDEPVKRRGIF